MSQEEALKALNDLLDHNIIPDYIDGETESYDNDLENLIIDGIELKMSEKEAQKPSIEEPSEESVWSPESADIPVPDKKHCELGIAIYHITSGYFNILKMSDGIKEITFDLDLMNSNDFVIDEDKVSGYALAFLGFILPAFHPQRTGSLVCSGKNVDKVNAVIDFNTDKFRFYRTEDSLLGYYVPESSLNEFIETCIDLNEQGKLVDMFKKISETLLSDGFCHAQLGDRIGVIGNIKQFTDISEEFMDTFINDAETVFDMENPSERMCDAISKVGELPLSYYEEIEGFFTLLDYEESDPDEEPDDDEDDDDDIDNEIEDDVDTPSQQPIGENEDPENIVEHMNRVMKYVSESDDDDADGLLDDIEDSEEVNISINSTEDNGVEANVTVSSTKPKDDGNDTDFVVKRR